MIRAFDALLQLAFQNAVLRDAGNTILVGVSKCLAILVSKIGQFRRGVNRAAHSHQDFGTIVRLEEVLHIYSQSQNEELSTERRNLLASITPFIAEWFYNNEIDWFRKRALDRAAVYGLKSQESGSVL
ncbi:hypothetical protein M408DRAFT_9618 [Serendipita vermifera MAFF 305830]|uniref:Uncharacterized protein n=1 Tax=Serendipita vermifera MAFF 305830 TaxID=933852 RepID=A0A0C2WL24_SERVB|nr:hypothetical protein M408DRAFT_9618 [Serendipita vermifera MAFF 305830]